MYLIGIACTVTIYLNTELDNLAGQTFCTKLR